jgi:hypothetical protein
MVGLPITQADIAAICDLCAEEHASLRNAIIRRMSEKDCADYLAWGKLLLNSPTPLVDDDLIERFRQSRCCIRQYPDPFNSQLLLIDIKSKAYFMPTPQYCFHATPADNEPSIRQIGIVPGRNVNQQNGAKHPDGIHYVHAALTLEIAFEWAKRVFGDKSPIVFPIRLQEAGYRLYLDTAAGNDTAYIIDTPCVEPKFLNEPFRQNSSSLIA